MEEYAEKHNLLLVGAANKSELLTGWFAPNGVDDLPVAPILGLYKNQVTQMAEHLNVPNEIINAKPSPDMLKGISDEDIIGFPYDKIDKVAYVVENGLPQQHACHGKFVLSINHLKNSNYSVSFSRNQRPPGCFDSADAFFEQRFLPLYFLGFRRQNV